MSALTITVKMLLAGSGVTAIAGTNIYPVFAPQQAAYPNIVVYLIHQEEDELLLGASQWPEARVSIECRAEGNVAGGNPVPLADRLAEAVISWLRDKDRYAIDGCEVFFRKEGSDETDRSDNDSVQGVPVVVRRIIDYYVRYRSL